MADLVVYLWGMVFAILPPWLIWLYFFVIRPKRKLNSVRSKLEITIELIEMLNLIEVKLTSNEEQVCGLRLKRAERYLMSVNGVSLVEPRRAPAKYVGGHSGASVRIAKGVYWRVGSAKAKRVPQGDILKIIDENGVLHITNQRAVFTGTKQNREWRWDKLLNYSHEMEQFSSIIHVSSRQKGSGIAHPDSEREVAIICFAVDVGVASFYGELAEQKTRLNTERIMLEHEISSMKNKGTN